MSSNQIIQESLTLSPQQGGKINVGIIGGAGYTGGELLRILVNHPNVDIAFINSSSNAVLDENIFLTRFFFYHVEERIKVFYRAANATTNIRRIKMVDKTNAAFSGKKR